jgi:hypothetical protein
MALSTCLGGFSNPPQDKISPAPALLLPKTLCNPILASDTCIPLGRAPERGGGLSQTCLCAAA